MELEQQESGVFTLSGDTYQYREQLKALGGRWDGAQRAWVFPSSADMAALQTLALRSFKALAEPERQRFTLQQALRDTSAGTHVRNVRFFGETFPLRALLQELGAKWQGGERYWLLEGDVQKEAVEKALAGVDWAYYEPGLFDDNSKVLAVDLDYDESVHARLQVGCECSETRTCKYCIYACCAYAVPFEINGFTGVAYRCQEHGISERGHYE